jgi:hypothetical protein
MGAKVKNLNLYAEFFFRLFDFFKGIVIFALTPF